MKLKTLPLIIYFTVFASSMAIMFLQLVAGRVIAQYLGQSLFTWTGIIATTLAGIALGNHIGGILADKFPNHRTIPIQFLSASIFILLIFYGNQLLGSFGLLLNMPWKWRIFTHIFLLFIIPFFLLGTISPVLTHLLIQINSPAGTRIGIFFAFSLLGSLIGTFTTGYILLAHFSYTTLLSISSGILFVISIAYFLVGSISIPILKLDNEPSNNQVKTKDYSQGEDAQPFYKLLLLSFWAGSGIMILEIVAGRLLAQNFGNSLYTWTTIIGVVLGSLSAGGYIGGYLGQHFNPRKVITFFLFLTSVSTLLIPLSHLLLPWNSLFWDLSWPVQIFIHSIIVFGPASIAFGALPPLLVCIIHSEVSEEIQGEKIGKIYAMNAVGGIIGVLITGYYTIAHWGSNLTLMFIVLVSALLFLWMAKNRWLAIPYFGFSLLLLFSAVSPRFPWDTLAIQLALKTYHTPDVVLEKESHYNYIKVRIPDPERPYIRDLILDKMIHNRKDMSQPLKLMGIYEHFFDAGLRFAFQDTGPKNILVIGGGGYTFCHFLEVEYPESNIEVAEIDPEVTKTAHIAFGLPDTTHLSIYHQDGRNRVEDLVKQIKKGEQKSYYDCVINDSFSDYTVPFHLTTKEFVEDIYTILSPRGIYMCNMIDCLQFAQFITSMYKTLREVFPHVYVYSTMNDPMVRDTFILICSKNPIPAEEIKDWVSTKYGSNGYYIPEEKMKQLHAYNHAPILTDQYAPVENLLAPMVSLTEETPYIRRLTRIIQKAEKGQNQQAIQALLNIIQQRPHFNDAYVILAQLLIQEKRFAEAVVWSKKLVERMPNEVKGYILLGMAYAQSGNNTSAIETWEKALAKDPNLINIQVNLSSMLIQQKQFERAEKILKTVQGKEPALEPTILSNLASLYFAQGKWNESLKALTQLEQIQPQNYFVKEQMAIVYYYLGDFDRAREIIQTCQKGNHPVNPQFLQLLEQKK
ncbi:MAG: fused MFS/spermidine synthase [Candidatus Hydrogenedens sp.]